jgi:hypothetical protein
MEDLYFNLEELDNMSRSEIQALCKKFGIRANIKTDKMKEKLRKYHEEHLNGANEGSVKGEKSDIEEGSQIEPSSVSESLAESAAESEVETMDIVPEHKEESAVEESKEEVSAVEAESASEAKEQNFEQGSEVESKMEVESTVTEAPIETKQTPVPKIDFPPYEVKEADPNAPVFVPYSELQPTSKAPMTPRTKKRVDGIRKNHEEKSKNRKIAVLDEKRKHLAMVVDKISVIKRTTKPTELPKIDDSIDTPKKKSSLTWSEIEASAEANDIPLNQEDIDKFLERKKERIQHQLLLSKGPSMLHRGKPIPETFDEFVSHLVKPKEQVIVRLAPGQTGFEFNPKVEKVVPSTPGTTRGVQSKFGFSAVKTSFTSAASSAVNNAKVSNTAKPAVKTQNKTGANKATATKTSTASNGDYVLGTKNLNNLKEAGSATQAKPRASIATASNRVVSTATKPAVAQSKIDSRRSLLPTSAATSATKTVTKPVASRPSMITKPVSRQSLVPSRLSTVTKPTAATSKTASALPAKSNIVKPITAASLKQAAAAKAAQAEVKPVEAQAKSESTSAESKVAEVAPKVEAKSDATKVATTTAKAAPRQSLLPKPSTVTKTAASTSVTKTSTTTATKPVINKPAPTTAAKAPLAAAKSTTKPSIATLIKKRKLDDASASGPAAKKQKTTANNENIENMQNVAVSAPVGVSF